MLKSTFIQGINRFAHRVPLHQLIQWSEQYLFLPFYHAIEGEERLRHIHHLYPVRTKKQFEADLDYLLQYFTPISIEDLIAHVQQKKLLKKAVMHLSFDDGLREVYDIAFPILKRKGIPASVFVNSAFVDNKALFYRYKVSLIIEHLVENILSKKQIQQINQVLQTALATTIKDQKAALLQLNYHQQDTIQTIARILNLDFDQFLQSYQPYLTIDQLTHLQNEGFRIGAHSIDHPLYAGLSLEDQLHQTEESIQYVQEKFSPKHNIFSFPFTDDGVERTFFEILQKDEIIDLSFGCAGLKKQEYPFHFQRFPMEKTPSPAKIAVNSAYAYFLSKGLIGKNQMNRL